MRPQAPVWGSRSRLRVLSARGVEKEEGEKTLVISRIKINQGKILLREKKTRLPLK